MVTENTFKEMKSASEEELQQMGGKAGTLARLLQQSFPVPEGAVLFHEPQDTRLYEQITNWWEQNGSFPVAVRSSASGEDSGDFSYAGQFVTLLHVVSKEDLIAAIKTCFQAVHRQASQAYASHFDQPTIPMHVLIQRMIDSRFSGVYFSVDPRQENSSWLIEVVEGQGEQLVSGQVTPYRFSAHQTPEMPRDWQQNYLKTIIHWGQEVEKAFGYKVDMEWAIDQDGKFWILQSRPITAQAAPSQQRKILDQEWKRILQTYAAESTWDGHTFAEWTGVPTELTFDLWQKTFAPGQAFDLALQSLGYSGMSPQENRVSLLDRIYGRAYLNLNSMEPVYFGKAPYSLKAFPRPHLEFDWKKLTLAALFHAPIGISQMFRVAWNIQTGRSDLAKKALAMVKTPAFEKQDAFTLKAQCGELNFEAQQQKLQELCSAFTKEYLQGTFLITLLIESTTQGLLALLEKDFGAEKAQDTIHVLTGFGLQTVASAMHQELSQVQGSADRWNSFLSRYGHRGVGELELSHPRWIETQQPHFRNAGKKPARQLSNQEPVLEELLTGISALRRPVFKQEWQELQKLMQIREEIKMELMKPYAQIRWLVATLGDRCQLGPDIFWLQWDEVFKLRPDDQSKLLYSVLINERKQKALHLKSIDLPMLFSLQELKEVLHEEKTQSPQYATRGVSLSPGLASGVVHIVNNPEDEDLDSWPEDYILVTEATDPGWTPLFERAKAVVVSRGGVLSHCAIVAREMGLPAVGEIRGASHIFKEGERVWVDGNHGTVRRTH